MDWVLDDWGGEQRIEALHQSITTAAECDIDLMTKGA